VELALETPGGPEQLELRACSCAFCRRHGARTTSDPAGRLEITVRNPTRLIRYRFGLRTADFLVCATCGVYVAAVLTAGERAWASVNVNALDAPALLARRARPVSYDGESEEERTARRRARWTPAAVVERG
jgi:hypothetical protein